MAQCLWCGDKIEGAVTWARLLGFGPPQARVCDRCLNQLAPIKDPCSQCGRDLQHVDVKYIDSTGQCLDCKR